MVLVDSWWWRSICSMSYGYEFVLQYYGMPCIVRVGCVAVAGRNSK